MVLVSIQIGAACDYPPAGTPPGLNRPWRSAILKIPVSGSVRLGPLGLEGDTQVDRRYHGGPDRALLAYSADNYTRWREDGDLPAFPFGAFGENLTIEGLDETSVCIGDIYRIAAIRVEVSQPRQPCANLARRWQRPDLPERVRRTGRSGWYLRVLNPGVIEAGQPIQREVCPHPAWSIARASQVMQSRLERRAEAEELASLEPLSPGWRTRLTRSGE